MIRRPVRFICAALLCVCLLPSGLAGCGAEGGGSAIGNDGEVVAAIRAGLRAHSRKITVSFSARAELLEELPALTEGWMEEALEETDDPAEGDYIRYQCGGYEISCASEPQGTGYYYTASITPKYYMYLSQEAQVTEKLEAVMDGFGFDGGTTDYEKIRAIYDYVCANIDYDLFHRSNRVYTLRSTAYAGLVRGRATCQGYCVTLYRMLRTAGVDCRIVTGTGYRGGEPEFHAWNIVALDGLYYALDATWDAGRETPMYFLKGRADFAAHEPAAEFLEETFARRYPMAETAYDPDGVSAR